MAKRYTEEQVIKPIKKHEAGAKVGDICCDLSISSGTFHNWRKRSPLLAVLKRPQPPAGA